MKNNTDIIIVWAICFLFSTASAENRISPLEAYKMPARAFILSEVIGQPTNPPQKIADAAPVIVLNWSGTLRKKASLHGSWAFLPIGSVRYGVKGSINEPDFIDVPGFWAWSYGADVFTKACKPGPYQNDIGIAWYSCKFTIPQDLNGCRIKLVFEGVCAGAEVWLNDTLLKSHIGNYVPFEVDLTARDILGSENILAVKVVDYREFCMPIRPDGTVKLGKNRDEDDRKGYKKRYITGIPYIDPGSKGVGGGLGGIIFPVYLEVVPIGHIDEVFINPGLTGIKFDVSFQGLLEESSDVYVQTSIVSCNDNQVLAGSTRKFKVSDTKQNSLRIDELSPELWEPENPNLYNLNLDLYVGNQCIDRKIERFGFRTFGIRGSRFYFNGRPYYLRGANRVAYYPWPSDEKWIDLLTDLIKAQGQAVTRFHLDPPSSLLLDACDEKGIMVIWEAPNNAARHPYRSARYWAQVREEYTAMVKSCRNRPSVIMWYLGNENGMILDRHGYKTHISWEREGQGLYPAVGELKQLVHSLDNNSRPVVADAFCMMTEHSDAMDWHNYPGWYEGTIYGFQKILDDRITATADFIAPQIQTEFAGVYTIDDGLFFQKGAAKLGVGTSSDPADHLWYQAFASKELTEMMRRMRVNPASQMAGVLTFGNECWFFNLMRKDGDYLIPKPVFYEVTKALQPILISFDCWDRHQAAGSDFDINLVIINDEATGKDIDNCRVELELKDAYGRLVSRVMKFVGEVEYYDVKTINMMIPIPAGMSKGAYTLEAILLSDTRIVSRNDIKITIYPTDYVSLANQLAASSIGVYGTDSNSGCVKLLKDIGFSKITVIDNFDKIDKIKLLVIAPDGVDDNLVQNKEKLNSYVSKGGKVLSLEQSIKKWSDKWLPFGIPPLIKNECGDNAEMVDVNHPVFSGINAMDLRFWNSDTLINKSCFKVCGPGTLARVFYARKKEPADATASAIEHIRFGKGQILLSQLLIASKAEDEPVARKLLANMITYLLLEK